MTVKVARKYLSFCFRAYVLHCTDCPAVKLTVLECGMLLTESSLKFKFPMIKVNVNNSLSSTVEYATLIEPYIFGRTTGKVNGERTFGVNVRIPFDKSAYCPERANGKCHKTI